MAGGKMSHECSPRVDEGVLRQYGRIESMIAAEPIRVPNCTRIAYEESQTRRVRIGPE